MHTKRKQNTMRYQKSEGSLALADESPHLLQKPSNKRLIPILTQVPAITEEDPKDDALAPAMGIISAIGLSVMLWGLIILGIYCIGSSL